VKAPPYIQKATGKERVALLPDPLVELELETGKIGEYTLRYKQSSLIDSAGTPKDGC
jgi:hypothetical protein